MRIAQIAPLFESVPPHAYGGTERVVAYLTEELVRQGHDVTLFASADSRTSARFVPGCSRSLRTHPGSIDPLAHHLVMLEQVARRASQFDVLHFHMDYLHFPVSRRARWPTVTTLHGRLDIPDLQPLYDEYDEMPVVSISDAQRVPMPQANWQATVHHGLPADLFRCHEEPGAYLAFLGRVSPEKRVDRAVEIARASSDYREMGAGTGFRHRARFYPGEAARLRDLYELVGGADGTEILIDDKPMPFAREQNPSQPHTWNWTEANQSFQHYRNAWEPIYNHYVNRMGLSAPNVARMLPLCEPNYWSGNGDDMVFPTLAHRRAAYAGPMKPPSGLTAHLRDGRAVLSWWGSVGAESYVVKRGATANGPFIALTTLKAGDLLTHTDAPPNGIWFYQVTAQRSGGVGASSNTARVAVPGEARFSMPLNDPDRTGTVGALQSPTGTWTAVEGKLLDAARWGEGRRNDKAIAFDGKSSGLQLPPGIFSNLDDFTLSMWAYANSLRWDSCLFFAGHDAFSYMRLAPKAGTGLRFAIAGAGFNDEQALVAPWFMPIRRWVHLAVTLQGGTGRLYVDGKEVARSDNMLLSPRQVGDQVAFLGRNWGHPPFDGRIQGFRVDAGARGAAEIAALAI